MCQSYLTRVWSSFAPGGYLHMYSSQVALPAVGDQVANLEMPVLILQGALDANVPPDGASRLAEALKLLGNTDMTLHVYPNLGHSLGESPSLEADNFQPISRGALDDVAAWLVALNNS